MSIAATYRQLLRNGPLTRLFVGEFISSIGDWLYLVALVVLVYEATGDPVILGIVGAARMLPYILLSIPAGVIADRFDRRLVLLTTDLARAVCMLAMAWLVAVDGPLVAIAAVAILAACFSTFFYPAIGALIPSLVRDEREFGPANSAWATLDNLAWIVGPGIAGLLLATGELVAAFVINAASFTLIAVILWSLPPSKAGAAPAGATDDGVPAVAESTAGRPEAGQVEGAVRVAVDGTTQGGAPSARATTRRILGRSMPPGVDTTAILGIILMDTLTWFAFGGITILIVFIAIDVFHGGDAATGYLNAAIGIGGTVGALFSGALVLRPRLGPVLLVGGAITAVAVVVLGAANLIVVAFAAIAVASAGNLILDVTRTTIFQRVVPDAYRGRFSGLLLTTQSVSEAGGTLLVPLLVTVVGFGWVMGLVGVAVGVATAIAVRLIGVAGDVPAGRYDVDLKRIARLPLFGGLSPARVEGALHALQPMVVAAGEVIVRQGDPADRFFVIGDGSFSVSAVDDEGGPSRELRTLGIDDVFGERGILARAPRSATVTAATDGLLFMMDGEAFLELVGARPAVADRLLALYDTPVAEIAARS